MHGMAWHGSREWGTMMGEVSSVSGVAEGSKACACGAGQPAGPQAVEQVARWVVVVMTGCETRIMGLRRGPSSRLSVSAK